MVSNLKKRVVAVTVTISNKPFLNDPEGETVLKDLILKEDYEDIISVRSAKSLVIRVLAYDDKDAIDKIQHMCEDLRIYNPIVSTCEVTIAND